MKLTIQVTENVTLQKTHVIEVNTDDYPILSKMPKKDLTLCIQQEIHELKDKNGNALLQTAVQSPGIEEINDVVYEVDVRID